MTVLLLTDGHNRIIRACSRAGRVMPQQAGRTVLSADNRSTLYTARQLRLQHKVAVCINDSRAPRLDDQQIQALL
jgi:hypothetical protein